ncbi:hypothetical protein [Allorhodopirellula solitaria]|uniref:Twin-arginine translocation signal domain-containing protein n=1 Tax=Allorhodopirellula solitaria TaxID=2527987 RepID=A0A5C5X0X5_9BACT|nr:hypothetical protein [Allorhodopirellula solitaria]TWT56596.1 hypothetical protein CA85_41300 [Allorhodopirellula solitaria]
MNDFQHCLTRRRFLKAASAIQAGSLIPWTAPTRQALAASPNERRRFALIGVGGNDTRTAPVGQTFADLVALCDVDSSHLAHGNGILFEGELERIFVNRGKLTGKPVEELAGNPVPEDANAASFGDSTGTIDELFDA